MFKKLTALYALIRKDARILWYALRHPARPAWLVPSVALIGLYLLSPIDLIPDVLPVIGLVDDFVLIPLVIAWLVSRLPADLKRGFADDDRTIDVAPPAPLKAPLRSRRRWPPASSRHHKPS